MRQLATMGALLLALGIGAFSPFPLHAAILAEQDDASISDTKDAFSGVIYQPHVLTTGSTSMPIYQVGIYTYGVAPGNYWHSSFTAQDCSFMAGLEDLFVGFIEDGQIYSHAHHFSANLKCDYDSTTHYFRVYSSDASPIVMLNASTTYGLFGMRSEFSSTMGSGNEVLIYGSHAHGSGACYNQAIATSAVSSCDSGPSPQLSSIAYFVAGDASSSPPLAATTTAISNVLFLPGIEGSRLYEQINGGERKLWELNLTESQLDAQFLYLSPLGETRGPIYTKPGDAVAAITTPLFSIDVYRTFFDQLKSLRDTHTIGDYLVFPYDWRMSPTDVVEKGTSYQDGTHYLDQELISLASTSPSGKVTIIAHSNGGLVAKALMLRLQATGHVDLVNKIIFVDVPQLGTPMAIQSILHGDFSPYPGYVLLPQNARGLGLNMPDAFALLPSPSYFQKVLSPVVDLTNAPALRTAAHIATNTISDESTFEQFMTTASGRAKPDFNDVDTPEVLSTSLFTNAKDMHSQLDAWSPPPGLQVIQIAGWGKPTPSGVAYTEKSAFICLLGATTCALGVKEERVPITVGDGDDTVVSASEIGSIGSDNYYLDLLSANQAFGKNWGHSDITESQPFQALLPLLLTATSTIETLPRFITTNKPVPTGTTLELRVHSPVSLDVYDSAGRHTGKLPNPGSDLLYKEEAIPNSSYQEFGEEKYVSVPNDPGTTINLHGLDTGTFTLDIVSSSNNQSVTKTYTDIPVTPAMIGTLLVATDGTASSSLALDENGDGKVDISFASTTAPEDPLVYMQTMRTAIISMNMGTTTKTQLVVRLNNVEHLLMIDSKWDAVDDDNDAKDTKKGERLEARILRKLDKIDAYIGRILSKLPKKRTLQERISATEAAAILNMNLHLKSLIK